MNSLWILYSSEEKTDNKTWKRDAILDCAERYKDKLDNFIWNDQGRPPEVSFEAQI